MTESEQRPVITQASNLRRGRERFLRIAGSLLVACAALAVVVGGFEYFYQPGNFPPPQRLMTRGSEVVLGLMLATTAGLTVFSLTWRRP